MLWIYTCIRYLVQKDFGRRKHLCILITLLEASSRLDLPRWSFLSVSSLWTVYLCWILCCLSWPVSVYWTVVLCCLPQSLACYMESVCLLPAPTIDRSFLCSYITLMPLVLSNVNLLLIKLQMDSHSTDSSIQFVLLWFEIRILLTIQCHWLNILIFLIYFCSKNKLTSR